MWTEIEGVVADHNSTLGGLITSLLILGLRDVKLYLTDFL